MPNREILNADPCGDLIVKNAVNYGRADTHSDDGERTHGTSLISSGLLPSVFAPDTALIYCSTLHK
jgi:hypothetical protein